MSGDWTDLIAEVTAQIAKRGGTLRPGSREWRMACPVHDDKHPSCDWNDEKGTWHCLSCGASGNAVEMARHLDLQLASPNGAPAPTRRSPTRGTNGRAPVTQLDARPAAGLPNDEQLARLRHNLVESADARAEQARAYLRALGIDPAECGWGLASLSAERCADVGLSAKAAGVRLIIPVHDATGRLVDCRRYAGPFRCTDTAHKCVPWRQGTGAAAPYGWHNLPADADPVIWCEGEKDCEALRALGVPAVSHTCGANAAAKVARELPTEVLVGRRVLVWFDHDDGGRRGAERLAHALRDRGVSTAVAHWPEANPAGFDFSDAILRDGADPVRQLVDWAIASADWQEPTVHLPTIRVDDRQLSEVTDESIEALCASNDPPELFLRSGRLVRVTHDETGWPGIVEVGGEAVRGRLARVARWTGSRNRPVHPPMAVAQTILAEPRLPLPPLEAICQTPTLRPDGSVLAEPGYDPVTHLVYAPPTGLRVPAIADRPTDGDLSAAREQLGEVLRDFPFIDQASYANLLALWLTPVVRGAIDGPVPLAIIDAPSPGTGKSLLVETVAICVTGRATFITAPGDEDEWRKRLTALIVGGASIVAIDNVPRRLASDQLAAVLTANWWEDRELGKTGMVRLKQRATWVATGNNIALGGDLPRRCYWIRLDAGCSRPWERTEFRIANLRQYVTGHRGDLLAALLTLARAWVVAGSPQPEQAARLGGFEQWSELVGGVLTHAGVPGFLGNQEALYNESDEDGPVWEAFLRAWHRCFADKPVRTAEVIEAMTTDTVPAARELEECLPPWASDANGHPDARKLGNSFKRYLERRYGADGIRLCRDHVDGHAKVARWCVRIDAGSAGSAGPGQPQRGKVGDQISRVGLATPRMIPQTPQATLDDDFDPYDCSPNELEDDHGT